jgi:hypothetical protein
MFQVRQVGVLRSAAIQVSYGQGYGDERLWMRYIPVVVEAYGHSGCHQVLLRKGMQCLHWPNRPASRKTS